METIIIARNKVLSAVKVLDTDKTVCVDGRTYVIIHIQVASNSRIVYCM